MENYKNRHLKITKKATLFLIIIQGLSFHWFQREREKHQLAASSVYPNRDHTHMKPGIRPAT